MEIQNSRTSEVQNIRDKKNQEDEKLRSSGKQKQQKPEQQKAAKGQFAVSSYTVSGSKPESRNWYDSSTIRGDGNTKQRAKKVARSFQLYDTPSF